MAARLHDHLIPGRVLTRRALARCGLRADQVALSGPDRLATAPDLGGSTTCTPRDSHTGKPPCHWPRPRRNQTGFTFHDLILWPSTWPTRPRRCPPPPAPDLLRQRRSLPLLHHPCDHPCRQARAFIQRPRPFGRPGFRNPTNLAVPSRPAFHIGANIPRGCGGCETPAVAGSRSPAVTFLPALAAPGSQH
jgi:hypothetical protein